MTRPVRDVDFDRDADAYRRAIVCRRVDETTVSAELADDFHPCLVTFTHDDHVVTDVIGDSVRWPWSTCPEAARNLAPLVGMPLGGRFTDAARHADPRQNCTHQFDCAAHAIRHAAREADQRRFDVEVPRRDTQGRTTARLWVDGALGLTWELVGMNIEHSDPPLPGAPPRSFMAWADETLEADAAEQAIVMRRATVIGLGRGWPFDDHETAAEVEIATSGVCYTMTAGRAATAVRVRGSIADFSERPEQLLP